ncbi:MAG: hypothetical protein LH660_03470, partial [Phormidesmis sp. CAN_BIN36]|nr:hypothetical protein [Phormidesmis sp. CAN_BIN36]
ALLNGAMNCKIRPHPHPLPKGEGTRILAPFSLGRRAGEGFAPLREEGIFILRFSNAENLFYWVFDAETGKTIGRYE